MLTPQKHTSGVKTPCGVLALDAGDESPAYLSKNLLLPENPFVVFGVST